MLLRLGYKTPATRIGRTAPSSWPSHRTNMLVAREKRSSNSNDVRIWDYFPKVDGVKNYLFLLDGCLVYITKRFDDTKRFTAKEIQNWLVSPFCSNSFLDGHLRKKRSLQEEMISLKKKESGTANWFFWGSGFSYLSMMIAVPLQAPAMQTFLQAESIDLLPIKAPDTTFPIC